MKKIKFSVLSKTVMMASFSLGLLSSCDVHQFPEPKDPDQPAPPLWPEETMTVPLDIVYNPDFYIWEHIYDPNLGSIEEAYPEAMIYPEHPATTSKYDNTLLKGVMDVHVKAYLASGTTQIVKEQTFSFTLNGNSYDTSCEIELPVDTRYQLAVWSHLRTNEEALPFYNSSDFNRVALIGDNYNGNTDYRDGFKGKILIDTYSEPTTPYVVNMTRPMGKFEFVTIDLSEFLDRETTRRSLATRASADEYIVMISFPYYLPSSYSVLDDRLENAATGVSFRTRMTVESEKVASLGFEYVMLNNIDDSAVQVRVDVYDPSYTHVAGSTTLTVPMKRDRHTLLHGTFLSEQNQGGVGIDPGFNGDHNVIP